MLTVYRGTLGPVTGMFCGVGTYEKILHPDQHSFFCKTPRDWNRTPVLRLSEIVENDYILFEPVPNSAKGDVGSVGAIVTDFQGELELLRSWINDVGSEQGVRLESETSLRLLHIFDKRRFSDALETLKGEHTWRSMFCEINPPKWIDTATVDSIVSQEKWRSVKAVFGERLLLELIAVELTEGGVVVDLLWRSLQDQRLDYTTVFELLDETGAVLLRKRIEQDPGRRFVNAGTCWREVTDISSRRVVAAQIRQLAVRVADGSSSSLTVYEQGEPLSQGIIVPLGK
jgi:hypothetical protein